MKPTLATFLQQHGLSDKAEALAAYAALLRQWNPKINLVAPTTLAQAEHRHVLDSAQLLPHLQPLLVPGQAVLDVGSGAGLPGLILAILLPEVPVTVAERDQRKAAFLHTAKHSLGLANVTVHADDVTALAQTRAAHFAVITGRAFTETARFVAMTAPLLAAGGSWLLLKGQAVSQELEPLQNMTITRAPSITEANGAVVRLTPQA